MKNYNFKLPAIIFILTLVLPTSVSAYFTTNQTATKINEQTILFTVDYQFGFANRELYMPIGATRGEGDLKSPYLNYVIKNRDEVITTGKTSALVFTKDEDVTIKNAQYHLNPGRSAVFTLVTLITIPDKDIIDDLDVSNLVTHLPFTMVLKDETEVPARLNPSELQYYQTPAVSLRK